MKPKLTEAQKADVAVIIARFQVPYLSDAHCELIQTALEQHSRVIIVLGLAPVLATKRNPLDFESRKQMILETFREHLDHLTVMYIQDRPTHKLWNKALDRLIGEQCPTESVVLYGGRDSFLDHYRGKYPTLELVSDSYVSGTRIREEACRKARNSQDFRAGVVYAASRRYDTCYPTVDIAVFNADRTRLLLARKEDEEKFRFAGGFASPLSASYEEDARREIAEEFHIEISEPRYLGSMLVDDWRYRDEADKIKTLLFEATWLSGSPRADDDIVEAKWFDIARLTPDDLVYEHRPLLEMLRTKVFGALAPASAPSPDLQ